MKVIKIIIFILLVLSVLIAVFINVSPQFGSNPSSSQRKLYYIFPNYIDGKFKNAEETKLFTEKMTMSKFFKSDSDRVPKKDIVPIDIDLESFNNQDSGQIKISWLGHSAFIINFSGTIVLLDPMLGQYAAPVPLPSLKRYSSKVALSTSDIDTIGAVVLSHDHYDHLDYPTIKQIKGKVRIFIVPHGVGNHLRKWGVKEESIIELNWHGKIYFSGDSGYGTHLKKIGDQHGPFDITLIDCGQYNKAWKYSHMFPEQSILAAQDLRGSYLMPIHWGAFTLSTHPWTEPAEILLDRAGRMGQKIILPEIGQIILLNEIEDKITKWWRRFN